MMAEQTFTRLTADEILAGLNRALQAERQAVANYYAHAQASDPAAYDRPDIRDALETLGDVEREHAQRLYARITALGGTPTSEAVTPEREDDALFHMLARDLKDEQWAIVEYARLVAGIVDDDETIELMLELLLDEIRHAGWLKATLQALATD
jgi:bacterioferritin (cytochrome b1)